MIEIVILAVIYGVYFAYLLMEENDE